MKRALVFLVLGPALAAITTLLAMGSASGPGHGFAEIVAGAVFFFTLPVSAITLCVDAALHDQPIALRAALTATIGALAAFGLAFLLFSWFVPAAALVIFAICGAACMGLCSLIAHDLAWQGFADSKEA